MQIEEMTAEQVTTRARELLEKAQSGGISPAETRELDSLQAVRSQTVTAKQARDRAFQEYRKVEQLPNARKNFSVAATAVTKQRLNNVGDYDSTFLRVQQKLEYELRLPMTVENIVRVLSDGSVDGLAPNPNSDELHHEKDQEERTQLIQIIAEDWSSDEHARSVKRTILDKPHVTLESLRQQVSAIRERNRLYELSPTQLRQQNPGDQAYRESSAQSFRAQDERQLVNAKARHDSGNYPSLPSEIDKTAIRKADGTTLRHWIKFYGDYQITQRLRGLN